MKRAAERVLAAALVASACAHAAQRPAPASAPARELDTPASLPALRDNPGLRARLLASPHG